MDDIRVEELKRKLDAGEDLLLIDVREAYERVEFNIGGEHIPVGSLPLHIEDLEDHKDKEIILYCRSGMRSGQAKMYMQQLGFQKVRNLLGGMMDWTSKFS